uniref:Uncharacterized protein n=1 Tax=Cannabis sativa TaxID=3483 RepID=A0A803RBC1_CANSA
MASSRAGLLRRMSSAPPLLSSARILVIGRRLYSICCRLSRSSSPHFSSTTEDPKKPKVIGRISAFFLFLSLSLSLSSVQRSRFPLFSEMSTVFGVGSWLHFKRIHAFGSSSPFVRGFSS